MIDAVAFVCRSCGKTFRSLPGPGVSCPHCGSLYAAWQAFERWRADPKRSAEYRRVSGIK